MPRQRRPSQNWPWGPKLSQVQNLWDRFVVFFLGSQNCNFGKVRRLKLLLSLKKKIGYKNISTDAFIKWESLDKLYVNFWNIINGQDFNFLFIK